MKINEVHPKFSTFGIRKAFLLVYSSVLKDGLKNDWTKFLSFEYGSGWIIPSP